MKSKKLDYPDPRGQVLWCVGATIESVLGLLTR
jgi:hypothetical protein